jgi:hypothetical protein
MTRKAKAATAPASIEPIDRPLTAEEKLKAFRKATNALPSWYAEQIAAGMTDADLQAALENSLGVFGGSCGPGELDVSYKGAGLRIWAGWQFQNTIRDKPLFSGHATMAMAREVYGITNPQERQMRLF